MRFCLFTDFAQPGDLQDKLNLPADTEVTDELTLSSEL